MLVVFELADVAMRHLESYPLDFSFFNSELFDGLPHSGVELLLLLLLWILELVRHGVDWRRNLLIGLPEQLLLLRLMVVGV